MFTSTEIAVLIKKYRDGDLTPDERLRLQAWSSENIIHKNFLDKVLEGDTVWKDALEWMELEESGEANWEKELERKVLFKVRNNLQPQAAKPKRVLSRLISLAAAVLFVATIGVLYYSPNKSEGFERTVVVSNLGPGGNRAQLTLENGQTVELSSERDGIIMGEKLTYNDGTVIPLNQQKASIMATLTTPKGGTYQITLPDGTKVWLNAASSLRYPTRFSAEQRVVELEGEAYFEVAKAYKKNGINASARLPFLVKTADQMVEVLGTHFNVMAYADEPATKTTLVEGSVLLSSHQKELKLKPGEQGSMHQSGLVKAVVDVNQQIAWKNNKFIFYETELKDAMKNLSRWYNLEVVYEGNIPVAHFYGEISRENGLAEVLEILKVGGVKFRIEKVGDKNRLVVLG